MSITIDRGKCIACGKCLEVCPGNLIYCNDAKKAMIREVKDCWGCAACLKECPAGAIRYYLGADIGGKGAYLYTKDRKEFLDWFIVGDQETETITINKKQSNTY
ncbi:MAG: 4Fe-4S dicluster domain-containing protein [Bacillota bacterium]